MPTGATALWQRGELLPASRLPACPPQLPAKAVVSLRCSVRGVGCEGRQLLAPAAALLRLGNLLSVFEPRRPKARKIGAVSLSRLLPSDSWSLLAPSPGSIPMDGLRLAAAAGYVVPCPLQSARMEFPSGQGTGSSSSFKIPKPQHLASYKGAQSTHDLASPPPCTLQAEESSTAS